MSSGDSLAQGLEVQGAHMAGTWEWQAARLSPSCVSPVPTVPGGPVKAGGVLFMDCKGLTEEGGTVPAECGEGIHNLECSLTPVEFLLSKCIFQRTPLLQVEFVPPPPIPMLQS